MEEKPTKKTASKFIYEFIKENILIRFGVLMKLVMDNVAYFSSAEITKFCYNNNIHLSHSSDYFPQGNGQANMSNKNLINIMKKLVFKN